MARQEVVDAVHERLGAEWNGVPVVKVNDVVGVPLELGSWLTVQFPVATSVRLYLNERRYRETGGFRILINVGLATGTDQALAWGNQIADLFCEKQFDGVRTQVPSSPRLDSANDQASYYTAAVVVPYTYDYSA